MHCWWIFHFETNYRLVNSPVLFMLPGWYPSFFKLLICLNLTSNKLQMKSCLVEMESSRFLKRTREKGNSKLSGGT
jgi:hypothetical protein